MKASFPSGLFREYLAARGNVISIGMFYVIEG